MDLPRLQRELRLRTREPYTPWGQKQNNHWDDLTRFIYTTPTWDALKQTAARQLPTDVNGEQFFAYAANRWFNFWSAKGVEAIFCSLDGVRAAKNPRDRRVDFAIRGITFDHKTSVFPKRFPHSLAFAQQRPDALARWLYGHQSRQQRYHVHNRLFIVLYDSRRGEHWKLRAELLWLEAKIKTYVSGFRPEQLLRLQFSGKGVTLSDIIWAVR